jgi:hypothetical protein
MDELVGWVCGVWILLFCGRSSVVYLPTNIKMTTLHDVKQNSIAKKNNEHREQDSNLRPPDPRERVLGT